MKYGIDTINSSAPGNLCEEREEMGRKGRLCVLWHASQGPAREQKTHSAICVCTTEKT